jgi:hypothetical protein
MLQRCIYDCIDDQFIKDYVADLLARDEKPKEDFCTCVVVQLTPFKGKQLENGVEWRTRLQPRGSLAQKVICELYTWSMEASPTSSILSESSCAVAYQFSPYLRSHSLILSFSHSLILSFSLSHTRGRIHAMY